MKNVSTSSQTETDEKTESFSKETRKCQQRTGKHKKEANRKFGAEKKHNNQGGKFSEQNIKGRGKTI